VREYRGHVVGLRDDAEAVPLTENAIRERLDLERLVRPGQSICWTEAALATRPSPANVRDELVGCRVVICQLKVRDAASNLAQLAEGEADLLAIRLVPDGVLRFGESAGSSVDGEVVVLFLMAVRPVVNDATKVIQLREPCPLSKMCRSVVL
jgi:hypothetical protein